MSADSELGGRARRGDATAMARMLVRTPSVNPRLDPTGEGEGAVARLAAGWLAGWGYRVRMEEVEAGRPNVIATLGEGSPHLLLNGHLDTVSAEGMSVPPFAAGVEAGRLLGRGACDMKGGVAALLCAAARLADEEWPGGRLTVALTVDEEEAGRGMEALVAGRTDADGAIVCEPTSLEVMPAHKGFLWAEVEFKGRAAHGSRPEEGIDAIAAAGGYLVALSELGRELRARPPHPLLGVGSVHAGTIAGGTAPSVYPASCRLVVERRTLPGEEEAVVLGELEALARAGTGVEGAGVAVRSGLWRPATEVDEGHPLVRGLLGAASGEGIEPRVGGMTAWVDAAFLNGAGVPSVCFGPGSIARAHAADEWIELSEIETAARVLLRFARGFLAGGTGSRDGAPL